MLVHLRLSSPPDSCTAHDVFVSLLLNGVRSSWTGGMVEFRRSLSASFLFKFLLHAAQRLAADAPEGSFADPFPPTYASAVRHYERPPSHGLQYFSARPSEDIVGQPYRHMAADMQVGKLRSNCPSAEKD